MKPTHNLRRLPLLAIMLVTTATSLVAQTYDAQSQITAITAQMNQLRVDIESKKLEQLKDRTRRDERAAQSKDIQIKRLQNTLAIRQLELAMYQQQLSFEKQARSPDPAVAAVQVAIQQLTLDKARNVIKQTQFTQLGNTKDAGYYAQLAAAAQAKIQIKQQELRVLQLKQKTIKP